MDDEQEILATEIDQLEAASQSAAAIATLRRQLLVLTATDPHAIRAVHPSLPAWFLAVLQNVVHDFQHCLLRNEQPSSLLQDWPATRRLARVLQIHYDFSRLDPTLSQELRRQGTHACLLKIIHQEIPEDDNNDKINEANQDALMELQDTACAIAALYEGSFPLRAAPLTLEELRQRLPLVFDIAPVVLPAQLQEDDNDNNNNNNNKNNNNNQSSSSLSVLIHQVTKQRQSEQKDVGFVMWPSAVVLARWLATNPQVLSSNDCHKTDDTRQTHHPDTASSGTPHQHTILEVGAGCGLTGLLAAKLLNSTNTRTTTTTTSSHQVLLTDFNPHVLENLKHNIQLNQVESVCTTRGLDFYQHVPDENTNHTNDHHANNNNGWWDMDGTRHDPVNVILGADIICQPADAVAASYTIHQALRPGGRAYIVCATSKHRFGVDIFPTECRRRGLRVTMDHVANLYKGALLLDGLEQTTGYVAGMELTMFTLEKPVPERDI